MSTRLKPRQTYFRWRRADDLRRLRDGHREVKLKGSSSATAKQEPFRNGSWWLPEEWEADELDVKPNQPTKETQ